MANNLKLTTSDIADDLVTRRKLIYVNIVYVIVQFKPRLV
jgi:hypothetical protein